MVIGAVGCWSRLASVRFGKERTAYIDFSIEICALAELTRQRLLRRHSKQCCSVTAKASTNNFCPRLQNNFDTCFRKQISHARQIVTVL